MSALSAMVSERTRLPNYRAALAQLAEERDSAQATATRATHEIASLLPGAIGAGISVVDAAELTGLSRPTVYRMLSEARKHHTLRDVATQFEQALELDNSALPYDLAGHFEISEDGLFEALFGLYPLVEGEFAELGQQALTALVELLPEVGVPEKIVLNMLLLQRRTAEYVSASTQLAPNLVLAWAALGLLRLLPRLREVQDTSLSSHATKVDLRFRPGDPRRHRRFAL